MCGAGVLLGAYLEGFRKTHLLFQPLNGDAPDPSFLLESLPIAATWPDGTHNGAGSGMRHLGWRLDCLGDLGFRKDRVADWSHMHDVYPQHIIRSGMAEAWRRGPVSLEICGYRDFRLALRLVGPKRTEVLVTGSDVRSWLPGDALYDDRVFLPPDLPEGDYQLQVGLVDPDTRAPRVRPPLEELRTDFGSSLGHRLPPALTSPTEVHVMQTVIAASLAALSLNPPVMRGEATAVRPVARRAGTQAGKVAGQAVAGAGIGLAAGVALAIPTFAIALCESQNCNGEGLLPVLVAATPLTFAVGEATGVYMVGKAVDKDSHGSFGRTLLGAVLGTGAGLAVWQGVGEGGTVASFASGVTVATAATIVAYELSRPKRGAARAPQVSVTPMVDAGRAGHGAGGGLRLGVSF